MTTPHYNPLFVSPTRSRVLEVLTEAKPKHSPRSLFWFFAHFHAETEQERTLVFEIISQMANDGQIEGWFTKANDQDPLFRITGDLPVMPVSPSLKRAMAIQPGAPGAVLEGIQPTAQAIQELLMSGPKDIMQLCVYFDCARPTSERTKRLTMLSILHDLEDTGNVRSGQVDGRLTFTLIQPEVAQPVTPGLAEPMERDQQRFDEN
jgi:hypothetical protein